MSATTNTLTTSVYLTLVSVGIGLTLQVLVLVVQNDASRDLVGTATAANNFFREIGASLGLTVVGTLSTARVTARPATGGATLSRTPTP